MPASLDSRLAALEQRSPCPDSRIALIVRTIVDPGLEHASAETATAYGEQMQRTAGETSDAFLDRARARAIALKPQGRGLARLIVNSDPASAINLGDQLCR